MSSTRPSALRITVALKRMPERRPDHGPGEHAAGEQRQARRAAPGPRRCCRSSPAIELHRMNTAATPEATFGLRPAEEQQHRREEDAAAGAGQPGQQPDPGAERHAEQRPADRAGSVDRLDLRAATAAAPRRATAPRRPAGGTPRPAPAATRRGTRTAPRRAGTATAPASGTARPGRSGTRSKLATRMLSTSAVGRITAGGSPNSAISARYADAPACPTEV